MINAVRAAAAMLLFAVRFVFLLLAGFAPFMAAEGAAKNREILALFQRTDSFVRQFRATRGRLPDTFEIRDWGRLHGLGSAAGSLSIDSGGCAEEGLARRAGDEFLLSVWRGEWADCFASPSGRHTMATSVNAYLLSGLGRDLLLLLTAGLVTCWLARRISPYRRQRAARKRDSHSLKA